MPMVRRVDRTMEPATKLRFEWVTEPQRFLALRDEWNLLGSSAIKTVFLTHAWLSTWLRELAPEAELHVLTAWQEDRLVAALPLFGTAEEGRGRRWAIMGTGTLTPNHLDIIAAPGVLEHAREGFFGLLLEESANWDMLEFDKLPADSDTPAVIESLFAQAGLATSCSVSAVCPYCDLPPTYEEYVASRKKHIRKEIRQAHRWIAEDPGARKLALVDTESAALEAQRSLQRFHQARWQARGYPGAFADPRVVRFHEVIVRASFEAGELRIYALTDGDETVAVSYNFLIGHTMQGYLSSFDERWAASSPGVLLRTYVMEQSIAEGAARFDFLEGAEHYKAAWCTSERENLRLRVFNRTAAGNLLRSRLAMNSAAVSVARKLISPELREKTVKSLARRGANRRPPADSGA
jgi:CelD/BcsL family acetyltransferase involved in cellulose biosynthesis